MLVRTEMLGGVQYITTHHIVPTLRRHCRSVKESKAVALLLAQGMFVLVIIDLRWDNLIETVELPIHAHLSYFIHQRKNYEIDQTEFVVVCRCSAAGGLRVEAEI
jgi:hypothetical protein